jgi:ArsR family transcriptional regulator
MVLDATNEIEVIQATLLRTLASVHRLRIIHLLGSGPVEVQHLASELGLPQATVSQHLAVMRSVALVRATRDGRAVRYELTDPEILAACDLMRNVLVRRLSALGNLAAAARVEPGHQARPPAARPPAARSATGSAGEPGNPHRHLSVERP